MDKFDRETQRELLMALYSSSPEGLEQRAGAEFEEKFGGKSNFVANLRYLEGHGLITSRIDHFLAGEYEVVNELTKITSKGIDFIRDDGGLGAILNVVNVRLHSDTLDKLEGIIRASGAPAEEKVSVISELRKLPADAIKHLNLKLLDMRLSNLPDVFHAIQNAMRHL